MSIRSSVIPVTVWVLLLSAGVVVVSLGPSEEAARQLIRLSATTSLLLFALAWSASSLAVLLGGRWRPVLRARRRIGIAFALSHTLHLAAIAWLVELAYDGDWWQVDPVGGAVIYTFIYLMALTSNDASVRLLGPRLWQRLHKVGGYAIWIAFTQSYVANALQRDGLHYPLFAVLCLALLLLRATAFWNRRPMGPGAAAEG